MSALILIDWENVSKNLREGRFNPLRFSRKTALERLFTWVKDQVGEIFDTFLFAPLHIVHTDYELFSEFGLVPMTCPKLPLSGIRRRDTVDQTLIEKGLKWITHQSLTHLCLVSGDSDFIPLIQAAKARGLKIMLSALDPSFARIPGRPFLSKELAKYADFNPVTGEKMIHYFSPMMVRSTGEHPQTA